MATTYRAHIDDGDHRTRMHQHFRFVRTVKRDSKSTERTMLQSFIEALTGTVPTPKGTAYLERSDRHGVKVLVRVTGRVTATRLGPSGCCQVPDAGEWVTAEGEVLARTGRSPS